MNEKKLCLVLPTLHLLCSRSIQLDVLREKEEEAKNKWVAWLQTLVNKQCNAREVFWLSSDDSTP